MRIGREFQPFAPRRGSVAAHVPNLETVETVDAALLQLVVRDRTRLAPTTTGIKPPPDPVGS